MRGRLLWRPRRDGPPLQLVSSGDLAAGLVAPEAVPNDRLDHTPFLDMGCR